MLLVATVSVSSTINTVSTELIFRNASNKVIKATFTLLTAQIGDWVRQITHSLGPRQETAAEIVPRCKYNTNHKINVEVFEGDKKAILKITKHDFNVNTLLISYKGNGDFECKEIPQR